MRRIAGYLMMVCLVGGCVEPPLKIDEEVVHLVRTPTPSPSAFQKISLRSEPLQVSEDEFREVFGLAKNRRPLNYFQKRFEVQGDVVVEKATGLMWQKSGSSKKMAHEDALKYIEQLNQERFAGFDDWRLPTVPELLSLEEPGEQSNDLYLDPIFDSKQEVCWSADTLPSKEGSRGAAWVVSFNTGSVLNRYLGSPYYVRAVRSGN